MASVGRMSFNIKKAAEDPSKWIGLTKGNKKLHQMHYWWEMNEKYSDELDKLDEISKTPKEPVVPVDAIKPDIVPEKEDPLKKIQQAAADAEFDQDVGKIVSPEELASRVEVKRVDELYKTKGAALGEEARKRKKEVDSKVEVKRVDELYKTKGAALGEEARKRKKEVDSKAKLEKDSIDLEIASRRLELDKERDPDSKGTDEL
eukprot:CAMPEP_0119052114 /NCGR_PEP_ID=MMETSP1177-20130426/73519_1 /TAXON_ID=2985 /ORGANISM="Ochromonas sp, Strain CCMP1899" /LENGTH=203 /DNA_ID=CAMNT_0007031575 /DNA_START=619 /DNA_END=1230 /DNA_ORIENTATION=-